MTAVYQCVLQPILHYKRTSPCLPWTLTPVQLGLATLVQNASMDIASLWSISENHLNDCNLFNRFHMKSGTCEFNLTKFREKYHLDSRCDIPVQIITSPCTCSSYCNLYVCHRRTIHLRSCALVWCPPRKRLVKPPKAWDGWNCRRCLHACWFNKLGLVRYSKWIRQWKQLNEK